MNRTSPELQELFHTYTGAGGSIGAHFGVAAERATAGDPLLVATGTDLALYPGNGAAPIVHGFRVTTLGFKEIAAVSHLGPAVATLAWMRANDPDGPWRADAERLLDATSSARAANDVELWDDRIRVGAFAGRAAEITAMVDYSCHTTERILERALADPTYLTAEVLRTEYLEAAPVPMNRVMVATFFLAGMDLAHRLLTWFDGLDLAWERAMVVIAGKQGRPTAGVTIDSNSVAGVIVAASRDRLPAQNLLIAPHAPVFPDAAGATALEQDYRVLWSWLRATSDLGEWMFAGHPRFEPAARASTPLAHGVDAVATMPAVAGPDDWFALVTRLRVVLEDPRQLLSGAVTDVAARELVACNNDPRRIVVPGLDREPYPALRATRRSA